ncbi:hypothetical protein K469DRAFT_519736, partial [Zopfia rhizophila CBS 207.26]
RLFEINSAGTIRKIRQWMVKCENEHPECRRGLSGIPIDVETDLPTRVIYVGPEHVRLVETKGTRGIYAALSYCWGGSSRLVTTNQNLEDLKRKIDLCWLPKTCREAIHIARELTIPYIWIDSLCIVQDNPMDWKQEAAKLGEIYERACLTIAANPASNNGVG